MNDPASASRLPATLPHGEVLVADAGNGPYGCELRLGPHRVLADEPAEAGGQDSGANPYEYLLAALGSCTSITVRMYAQMKKLPLTRVTVHLKHRKIHVQDCAECAEHPERAIKVDEIERHIMLEGALDDAQRQRLLAIAERCPVHQTLKSDIRIVTSLVAAA
jgi:putative redox protein